MPHSIRSFKERDLKGIARIEASSFNDPWPTSFFTYNYRKSPHLFIIAEQKEKILGYVVGEVREIMLSGRSYMSKMGHILNIAVDPVSRESGVGTSLMKEIEDRFRESEATHVTLEVRESNETARAFYKGMGFREIGRVPSYYRDEDAVVMSKTL